HAVQCVFEGGFTGDPVAARVAALRLVVRHQPEWQPAAKLHADHQLTVHGAIEVELAAVPNREVRHDFRIAPYLGSRLQGERLVDGHVVSEGSGRPQGTWPTRLGSGRVDHHAGVEFAVLVQVA